MVFSHFLRLPNLLYQWLEVESQGGGGVWGRGPPTASEDVAGRRPGCWATVADFCARCKRRQVVSEDHEWPSAPTHPAGGRAGQGLVCLSRLAQPILI